MRFNNIELLRLAAAVGVAVIHLSTYARHEFGIDNGLVEALRLNWLGPALTPLFFAVSGFVLNHVMQATSPGRFIKLRAVRLYPGYWLVAGLVTLVTAVGFWPGAYLRYAEPHPTLETFLLVPPSGFRLGQYPLVVEWTLIYEVVLWIWLVGIWALFGKERVRWFACAWLAVIAAKVAIWPDFGSQTIPAWKSVWLSVFIAPFLFGILAYELRSKGRTLRWPMLAAILALNAAAMRIPLEQHVDWHFGLRGMAAGITIWFLVQLPDAPKDIRLVRAGSWSYGLYLTHVPLMLLGFRLLEAWGVAGSEAAVAFVGFAVLAVGLAFGRFEVFLHGRLKRLADRRLAWPTVRVPGLARITATR